MSQSSSPGTPGILPGTDDPVFVSSPEDGFGAEPPPAPPAHAAEDGVDTPFASWSMSIPLTSTPPVPPPPAWAGPSDTDSERSSTEAEDPPPHPRPALPLRPSALMVSIPHFGPMGRRRPPASVVALSVCTLGVYALVWHSRVNREMGDFDPRMPVRAGRSTWALAIPVLLFWAAAAAAAMRVVLAQTAGIHANIGLDESVTRFVMAAPLAIPYAVLLLPFSLVSAVMTAERIRVVEDRVDILGQRQLRPAAMVCWLLLPLAGGLVFIAAQQRRLNAVWRLVGS